MAVINNLVVGLALRQGFKYLPDARRTYSARPLEGLKRGCQKDCVNEFWLIPAIGTLPSKIIAN